MGIKGLSDDELAFRSGCSRRIQCNCVQCSSAVQGGLQYLARVLESGG